jgi:hypothetical protein
MYHNFCNTTTTIIQIIHKDSQTTSRIEEAPSRKHYSF